MKTTFLLDLCRRTMRFTASGLLAFSLLSHLAGAEKPAFTVHEWGTFTQVSGSDGYPIQWWAPSRKDAAELPEFVQLNTFSTKIGAASAFTLRMETPVVYFYPPKPMTVELEVRLLEGHLTEWFPQPISQTHVPAIPPFAGMSPLQGQPEPHRWRLALHPPSTGAGNQPPVVSAKGAHYAHAREVPEAWLVHRETSSTTQGQSAQVPSSSPQWEKFLFYRGAGQGALPLKVTVASNGTELSLRNPHPQAISGAVLIQVSAGRLVWKTLPDIAGQDAGDQRPATLTKLLDARESQESGDENVLASHLVAQLVKVGLFGDEARAMVNTWRDSWLKEEGVRILCLLPRSWVDAMLPLTISPQPTHLERVFVARHEVLLPTIEKSVIAMMSEDQPETSLVEPLKALKLGRFENAVLQRVITLETQRMRTRFENIRSAKARATAAIHD